MESYIEQIVKENFNKSSNSANDCFKKYDKDRDGYLNQSELADLTRDLFCQNGKPYPITAEFKKSVLQTFDTDKDGKLNLQEFTVCWNDWMSQILNPVSAFIIVDAQNDFIDGTLKLNACPAKQDGSEVIPVINYLLDRAKFDVIVYSRDWHPEDHISFIENIRLRKLHSSCKPSRNLRTLLRISRSWTNRVQYPVVHDLLICNRVLKFLLDRQSQVKISDVKVLDTVVFEGPPKTTQRMWPRHCVQKSAGAEFHKDLKILKNGYVVDKGMRSDVDSYSAFWDNNKLSQTGLIDLMRKHNVTDVYTCGLAYDVCVAYTSLDALDYGFRTVLVEEACRGVEIEDMKKTKDILKKRHAVIASSNQVLDLVAARDRPPELGIHALKHLSPESKLKNLKINGSSS